MVHRHLVIERHQPLGQPRLFGKLDEILAPLLLLDFRSARQQRFEIAIFGDELGAGLDADAGNARHIVNTVARQRLHIDNLVGLHPEFFENLLLRRSPCPSSYQAA